MAREREEETQKQREEEARNEEATSKRQGHQSHDTRRGTCQTYT